MDHIHKEIQDFYEWPPLRRCLSSPGAEGSFGGLMDAVDSGCPMVTHLRSSIGECVFGESPSEQERREQERRQHASSWNGVIHNESDVLLLLNATEEEEEEDGDDDKQRQRKQSYSSIPTQDSTLDTPTSQQTKQQPEPEVLYDENDNLVEEEEVKTPLLIAILYGFINATIVLPVILSFANIIYRDRFFAPYTPILVQLAMFSSMVHQLSFSTMSSIPFAIGQVQDAGLIFLSTMASNMVHYCSSSSGTTVDDTAILATVTIGLGMATAILGVGLLIIGKLRLAQYVQRLPTCVVGGYLAYIGWFCGQAGLGLMANVSQVTPRVFVDKFIFVLPGLAGGFLVYALMRNIRHAAVLPTCILLLSILFYLILFWTNTSVTQATEDGWIRSSGNNSIPVWYKTWEFLRFDRVVWSAYPGQVGTLLSMIFVVALSSSLDIAAIDLELQKNHRNHHLLHHPSRSSGRSLDYNQELFMVGKSNLVSGLTGGYTGSYIFSQTIFSLRAGVKSRVTGYTLAFVQGLYLILPIPILSYVPNFFFGTMLTMICVDLMYSWLWEVRHKFDEFYEYPICLLTFGLIQVIGVEYGILGGFGLYLVASKLDSILCRRRRREPALHITTM